MFTKSQNGEADKYVITSLITTVSLNIDRTYFTHEQQFLKWRIAVRISKILLDRSVTSRQKIVSLGEVEAVSRDMG